ncbi:MAG: thiamine phosphate synthase [Persephonella sp.]|nr:MAG: thiamine phosphate synthase [Persephonella sp.]
MNKNLPKFYAITNRKRFKYPLEKQIKIIKEKGAGIIQLREKDLNSEDLYKLARKIRDLTKELGMLLTVNDRLDIAILVGADGVHLPEKSVPISVIKKRFPYLIVGKSCHSLECALNSEKEGADYIFISPIFFVEGKGKPIGLEGLKEVIAKVKIPIYALGGINKENLKEVFKTGVYGVASIRMFL